MNAHVKMTQAWTWSMHKRKVKTTIAVPNGISRVRWDSAPHPISLNPYFRHTINNFETFFISSYALGTVESLFRGYIDLIIQKKMYSHFDEKLEKGPLPQEVVVKSLYGEGKKPNLGALPQSYFQ
jgi:hypothetical protein